MAAVAQVQAFGLDRLGQAELEEFMQSIEPPLPEGAVTFQRDAHAAEYGEPGTIIVILSVVALKAFVAWLALRPRHDCVTQTISVTMGDGTVVTKTLEVKAQGPGDAKPELVREILSMDGLTATARASLESALSDGQGSTRPEAK